MTVGQMMLGEFDQEMQNTRKTLERCPDEKWNWKPHEKSGTLGWLASHVGTVPEWIAMTIKTEELDYAPVDGPSYQPPKIENRAQLLAAFDKASAEARAALASVSDADMMKGWKLLAGGKEIFTMPRRMYSRHVPQPLNPPSRTAHGVFPAGRRSCSGALRAQRG